MTNDYQSAMSVLPLINKGRADDTQAWQSICIALKNCGVPYEVFENWSITSRHQDRNQIRRAWENLNGNHTIGTLCYYAKLDSGALPVPTYRQPDRFDGEKAFASIIQPYSNLSEMELECELWERSPYRLMDGPTEKEFNAALESLYDPDDMLFVGTPLANAEEWTEKVENNLFRNNLELLGCDGACKNESRSSRTPGAIRSSNGVRQRLFYLNPDVKK